jgi:hypothetical protein
MDQPLHLLIKMEAASATGAIDQMLLYNRNFLSAEFPIYIEMETSSDLDTI